MTRARGDVIDPPHQIVLLRRDAIKGIGNRESRSLARECLSERSIAPAR